MLIIILSNIPIVSTAFKRPSESELKKGIAGKASIKLIIRKVNLKNTVYSTTKIQIQNAVSCTNVHTVPSNLNYINLDASVVMHLLCLWAGLELHAGHRVHGLCRPWSWPWCPFIDLKIFQWKCLLQNENGLTLLKNKIPGLLWHFLLVAESDQSQEIPWRNSCSLRYYWITFECCRPNSRWNVFPNWSHGNHDNVPLISAVQCTVQQHQGYRRWRFRLHRHGSFIDHTNAVDVVSYSQHPKQIFKSRYNIEHVRVRTMVNSMSTLSKAAVGF